MLLVSNLLIVNKQQTWPILSILFLIGFGEEFIGPNTYKANGEPFHIRRFSPRRHRPLLSSDGGGGHHIRQPIPVPINVAHNGAVNGEPKPPVVVVGQPPPPSEKPLINNSLPLVQVTITTTTVSPVSVGLTTTKNVVSPQPTAIMNFNQQQNGIVIDPLEASLNGPNFKCGTVPIYDKLYKRSINESFNEDGGGGDFRILHGLDSIYGEWPWIARIKECEDDSCGVCTGTLLNSRWVITAGHCGFNRTQKMHDYRVTLGLYDLISPDKNSFTLPIDKMIVHPDYFELNNDLTLLRLTQKVEFNDYIQPACLIRQTRNVLSYTNGKKCYTVGYGLIEGMEEAIKLQKLQINAKQPNECNSDELGSVQLKRGSICIGPSKIGNKAGGSCKGDSGGPDLCYDPRGDQWIIFGTVSYGPSDCDRDDGDKWLTVSVDLSNYRTWIVETINANSG